MKTLMVCLGVAVSLTAFSVDETTWKGGGGTVDWSASSNWSAGVPTGGMTAKFGYVAKNYLFRVTPGADFTGTLVVDGANASDEMAHPTMVELTVSDGAAWMVSGAGTVIATDGIAERLGTGFTGTVDIPAGRTFVAPATLASAVEFTGRGTLTVSTAEQLNHVSGFFGKLICPASVAAAPQDVVAFQDKTISLEDGATLTLAEKTLAFGGTKVMPGWSEANAWSFNGTAIVNGPFEKPFSKAPPYVLPNGDLMLVDEPGQVHSAFLTNRRFKLTDSWGVKFRWNPELPEWSIVRQGGKWQTWAGRFGFYFQSASPQNVSTVYKLPVDRAYGFSLYCYRADNQQGFAWATGHAATSGYDQTNGIVERDLDGITLTNAVDFTVTCHEGVLRVTIEQNGRSQSFCRSFKNVLSACGQGMYLGFGASSDYWSDSDPTIPWMQHRLSGFHGWCRSKADGAWTTFGNATDFDFATSGKWKFSQKVNGKTTAAWGAYVSADGTCALLPETTNAFTTCKAQTALKATDRYLVSFDVDFGAVKTGVATDGGEGMSFGFVSSEDLTKTPDSYTFETAYSWCTWATHLAWTHRFYEGDSKSYLRGSCHYYHYNSGEQDGTEYVTYSSPAFKARPSSAVHYDLIHDGVAGRQDLQVAESGGHEFCGEYAFDVTKIKPWYAWDNFWNNFKLRSSNMYLAFRGQTANWTYLGTKVKNVTVKKLTGNTSPRLSGGVAVADGASVMVMAGATDVASSVPAATLGTLELGSSATLAVKPVKNGAVLATDSVKAKGDATVSAMDGATFKMANLAFDAATAAKVTVTGPVAFGDSLTVTVPDGWFDLKQRVALLDCSAATGSIPGNVRVVTASGKDMTRRAKVAVEGGVLYASLGSGFALIFR